MDNDYFGDKYSKTRDRKLTKYRLRRRFEEILNCIKKQNMQDITILDIGSADGIVLDLLDKELNFKKAVGIDISVPKIEHSKIKLIEGSAEKLPFKSNQFDVVLSSSVIQYIKDKTKMISESERVLKEDGIIIITAPNPLFNKIAHKLNYYKKDEEEDSLYYKDISLKELQTLLKNSGFEIVCKRKFILFPFGRIPFESIIESFLRNIKLDFLMGNQIICGIKKKL